MPFILKINTDGEKFKERFDTKRLAIKRAGSIMDAGVIVKATKRSDAASYTPYKVWVTRMTKGNVVWERLEDTYEFDQDGTLITVKNIHDIVAEQAVLKIQDDIRYEEKRRWRVKEGLE